MSGILILAPGPADPRVHGRTGDAFDTAFVEALRTLDATGDGFPVLVPWTEDLAPLVLAATIDTAPSFDPEGEGRAPDTRSRIVPYRVLGAPPAPDDLLWRASNFSLTRATVMPLSAALSEHPPDYILALGLPAGAADPLRALNLTQVKVLTFGAILSTSDISQVMGIPRLQIRDLELEFPEVADPEIERMAESVLERSAEADLEPYVPYGLLLQVAFNDFLPGDERERGGPDE